MVQVLLILISGMNTVNNNTGGTPIPGATNSSYTPQNTTVGITYYYCW